MNLTFYECSTSLESAQGTQCVLCEPAPSHMRTLPAQKVLDRGLKFSPWACRRIARVVKNWEKFSEIAKRMPTRRLLQQRWVLFAREFFFIEWNWPLRPLLHPEIVAIKQVGLPQAHREKFISFWIWTDSQSRYRYRLSGDSRGSMK